MVGANIRPLVLVQFPAGQPETIKAVEEKLESMGYTYDNGIANGKYDAYKEQKGSIHKTEEFDLMLSKIYLGMNCTEENRELIINAVRKANDKRLRDAIGRSKKDKLQMYHVLYNMGEIITVWEVYADDALRLKTRNINVALIS